MTTTPSRRPSDPDGPTGVLSDYLAGARLDDLPGDVVQRAHHLLLDGIGCGLLAARMPWSELAVRAICDIEGDGPVSLWGWGRRVPAGAAALLHGTFVQGFELDDYHQFGPLHSAACVIPAVLASAQHVTGATGRDVVEAVCLGFEVGPRVGMSMGGLALAARGWHCGSVYGTLASAAGAGKVRKLDAAGFEDAIGIAATQASGLMSAQFGAMVKRMHAGMSARNGLYAAALAHTGFTGIKRVIERDDGGFAQTFSGGGEAVDLTQLTDGLGSRFEISRIAVKPPYACMGGLHSTIDAVREVTAAGPIPAAEVVRIRIGVANATYKHAGWTLERPATVVGAQMNLAYAAAVTLLDGAAFVPQFSPTRIESDDVWAMIEKTDVYYDETMDTLGDDARWTSRLRVELADGSVRETEIRQPWGARTRPLTNEELREKFRRMAGLVCKDTGRVDALERVLLRLQEERDLERLVELIEPDVEPAFG
jgi:aconitate decarboxylase